MVEIIDLSGWTKKRALVDKQGRFALAVALTRVAQDGQRLTTRRMPRVFHVPVAFTKRAVGIQTANKQKLFSRVFVKDLQAEYLAIQETGGIRFGRRGKPINVPVNIRVNRSGNIPRNSIKRHVTRKDTFTVGRRKNAQTMHLTPGLYQRFKPPKGRVRQGARKGLPKKARSPKLLISFEPSAEYRPRFEFKRTVRKAVITNFPRRYKSAIDKALATAR